jgi:hypothetical protein
MTIKLCESAKSKILLIELYNKPSTFCVEMQPDVLYSYNDNFDLIKIEVRNPQMIKPLLNELHSLLDHSDIKIIREVA